MDNLFNGRSGGRTTYITAEILKNCIQLKFGGLTVVYALCLCLFIVFLVQFLSKKKNLLKTSVSPVLIITLIFSALNQARKAITCQLPENLSTLGCHESEMSSVGGSGKGQVLNILKKLNQNTTLDQLL